MKILMVLDHEFPADTRVENELEALSANNHTIHIACLTRENRAAKENYRFNSVIHRKHISKFTYKTSVGALKFPFYFNFWRKYLHGILSEGNYDVIHIHDLPLAKVGREMADRYNLKFVLDLHENWPALLKISSHTQTLLGKLLSSDKQWRKYEKISCNNADSVIVVVEEAKERLVKLGINGEKINVVSNTLNLKNFKQPDTEPDNNLITALYSGGINKHRGLQIVIKGLKYLDLPKPFKLMIIGSGSYVDELKRLSEKEKVDNNIEFLGWKSFSEMPEYFGKADVFLIPHLKSEHTDTTIPHKLFQYMYCKRPIIASDCDPIKRIIEETHGGIIYKNDQPRDFARKLNNLYVKNSSLEQNVDTSKAYKAVLEKYNWQVDSKSLIKIYSEL